MSTAGVGRVRATAFAKLTLSLRVLGQRRADGFHELEALTTPIGQPHDALEAVAIPDPSRVTLEIVAGDEGVPTGHDNLAVQAAESLLRRAGRAGGVHLALRKRIPVARGLGGGSADAAAALLAVHRLIEVDVSEDDLFELAADLGSDVPFFLAGGPAWMRGRGELLERVALRPGLPMLVVMPAFPVATVDVYRAWDELGGPRSTRTVPSPAALAELVPELVNDLEPAAEHVEPSLRPLRERIENATGRSALLAGSGPTYVVLADGPVGLPEQAEELAGAVGVPVVASATVSKTVRLEI